jgi:CubicO group peptidase (beta-lactamase class C family)
MMGKILKYLGLGILGLLLIANLLVWITDTTYIYKALIYQQVDIDDLDIFDYNVVEAGSPKPWAISSEYNKKPLPDNLRTFLEEYKSVAYLIIKNDSIAYEEYWEGYSDTSHSNSFSMAKSVVSLLVGIAVDEGYIKTLDEPVMSYLPSFEKGDKPKVTIRNLLTMSSGLDFMESYSTPFNYTTEAYYGNDLEKMVGKLRVIEKPGTIYRYKSGDPQILEMILRKATGKPISEYLSEKVWKPIGAEHSAYWSVDHKGGHEKAYCCIYSNARDFAKIGKLYMDSGRVDSTQIVSKEWIEMSITPNYLPDEDGNDSTDYYGMQWWMMNYQEHQIYYMRGLGGQYVICIPDKDLIIVRLGHKRSAEKIGNHPVDVMTYIQDALERF